MPSLTIASYFFLLLVDVYSFRDGGGYNNRQRMVTFISRFATISSNPYQRRTNREVSSFSSSSNSNVNGKSTPVETSLRQSIAADELQRSIATLKALNSTKISSKRDIVYIIAETCYRSKNLKRAVPLIKSLEGIITEDQFLSTENDIIPMLSKCANEYDSYSSSSGDSSIKNNNNARYAYEIVQYLQTTRKVAMSEKAYSLLFKLFGRKKNENIVDKLFADIAAYGVKVDTVLLNTIIDSYIRCENYGKAIRIFLSLRSVHRTSNDSTISAILSTLGEAAEGDAGTCDTAGSWDVVPNVRTFNTILKCLRDERVALLDAGSGYAILMKSYLDLMRANGATPDSVTINTLVDCSVSSRQFALAEELLSTGSHAGWSAASPLPAPTVEAYTSLISGYADSGDVDKAFSVLKRMIREGGAAVQPNGYTLTSLMTACVNAGQFKMALNLIKDINALFSRQHGHDNSDSASVEGTGRLRGAIDSNVDTLRALYCAYVNGLCRLVMEAGTSSNSADKYITEAQRVLSIMHSKALQRESNADAKGDSDWTGSAPLLPDTATMNAFIQALSNTSPPRLQHALRVFYGLGGIGLSADDYTYSILFTALGKNGYYDEALRLYRSINATDKLIDLPAINSLLRAAVMSPQPLAAVSLYNSIMTDFDQGPLGGGLWGGEYAAATSRHNDTVVVAMTSDEKAQYQFLPNKITFTNLFLAMSKSMSIGNPPGVSRSTLIDSSDETAATDPPLPFAVSYEQFLSLRSTGSAADTPAATAATSTVDSMSIDLLVRKISHSLIFEYKIEIDDILLSVINSIFSTSNKIKAAASGGNVLMNGIFGSSSAGSSSNGKRVLSTSSAKMLFEELLIYGFEPQQLLPILQACSYSARQQRELLENSNDVVKKIRQSAITNRIFRKYNWNTIDSSFNSLGF